jgi:hypothetical protein
MGFLLGVEFVFDDVDFFRFIEALGQDLTCVEADESAVVPVEPIPVGPVGAAFTTLAALDEAPQEKNFSMDAGLDDLVDRVRWGHDFNFSLKALGLHIEEEVFKVAW